MTSGLGLNRFTLLAAGLLASIAMPAALAGEDFTITVTAGEVAREQSVAMFRLPAEGNSWRLKDEAGRSIPLQVTEGEAAFIVERLEAGATARYHLEAGGTIEPAFVKLDRVDDLITARVGGETVWSFHAGKSTPPDPSIGDVYRRAGYIHPLYTPDGTLVTGDYPEDHFHHHGIWFAWVKTEYEGRHPDFWNVGDGTGRVDLLGVDRVWSGAVHGGLTARLQSVDVSAPQPKPVIDETWDVRIYAVGTGASRYWMFDLTSSQRLVGNNPLGLPQYRYGGIGIRGHEQWVGRGDKTRFLTSTGERDRIAAHESRANWCHMGGLVDGQFAGIATLAHPENFRSPEPMRVNPKIPFLNFAPSQAGAWEMVPGKTYVWRYRFIVQDGEPDQTWLDARWRDYAHPMQVTIKPAGS